MEKICRTCIGEWSVVWEQISHLFSHDLVAKLIRKKKREMLSGREKEKILKTKWKISVRGKCALLHWKWILNPEHQNPQNLRFP